MSSAGMPIEGSSSLTSGRRLRKGALRPAPDEADRKRCGKRHKGT